MEYLKTCLEELNDLYFFTLNIKCSPASRLHIYRKSLSWGVQAFKLKALDLPKLITLKWRGVSLEWFLSSAQGEKQMEIHCDLKHKATATFTCKTCS